MTTFNIYKFSSYLTGSTMHLRFVARNSDHQTTEAVTCCLPTAGEANKERIVPGIEAEILVVSECPVLIKFIMSWHILFPSPGV
jgi:hypothetical protein